MKKMIKETLVSWLVLVVVFSPISFVDFEKNEAKGDEPNFITANEFLANNIIEKVGSQFEVSIDNSVKRSIMTSHEIDMRVELYRGMLVMSTSPSNKYTELEFSINSLTPNKTYYKYEDSYSNLIEIKADENGSFSFFQDVTDLHLIFIQDGKSTTHIKDDSTGGDCSSVGVWDVNTKTCKLEIDLNGSVEIDDNSITFDGNNHLISPKYIHNYGYGYGILASEKTNVTIKNVTVRGFSIGVNFFNSENFVFSDSVLLENNFGFAIQRSKNGIVQKNTAHNNQIGAYFFYSENNKILDNNFLNNLKKDNLSYAGSGIVFDVSSYNEFERNNSSNNSGVGLSMESSYNNNFYSNLFSANGVYGFSISGFQSQGNNFKNDIVKDNKRFDVMIYSGTCRNNKLENIIGSGDRPIEKIDKDNVKIVDGEYSELIMCGVLNAEVSGAKIKGSDDLKNNGLLIIDSRDVKIESVISVDNYFGISLDRSYNNKIKNSNFSGNSFSGIYAESSSNNEITENNISNNFRPIYSYSSGGNYIFNNNFIDNTNPIYSSKSSNYFNKALPIGGNYWKPNASCADIGNDGICDAPLVLFSGGQDNYPWTIENGWKKSGVSSVLFLPGIKASHLYKYDSETDHDLDELWVPNWFGNDVDELKLDNDGKSIEKVFTKEGAVLDEIITGNLYKSFLADLNSLKTDGVLNDYKAFAYDWRQSVEDIAKNGTPYENDEIKSIVNEINNLAQNSRSGKVTIVAHSNGGLVTKAVMAEYPVLAEKVDKIILVASPQMGTPLATLSFIYGYEESLPTLLSQSQARSLIENMPGAYGLLPSDEYLKRQKDVGESLINFSSENTERGKLYKDSYGDKIDSLDEFREFLLGVRDEREKPKESEINLENILNDELLDQAISIHGKLDSWTPPASMKVIQLGGWGLPTVNGINYVEKKETECRHNLGSTIPVCYDGEDYILIPEPKWTVDGDRTVTTPSALTMPEIEESENIKKYWFDMKKYGEEREKREHKNILEADDVRIFIKNEIISNNVNLPEYISTERPNDYEDAKPRIRMSLYSPLDIHLESGGKHTGLKEIETSEGPQKIIEENIPNSYYFQLGERKYVGFEEGEDVEIKLDGYGDGAYTLKIEEIKQMESGEEIINHITFKNLPTSENTKVEIIIPESGLENISDLKADYDGDDINDYVLTPVLGGEVTLPDTTPPSIEISSPQDKTYLKNEMMDIDYAVFDNRTNAEDIQIEKLLDDRVITQDRIDLSLLKVGEHKLAIKAIDEVDNVGEKEIVFNIATDVKVLRENIDHFYDLKLIKTNQERKMLTNNLAVIEREIEFYNNIKNNIFIKSKVKKILLRVIEDQIENHIDVVVKKIEKDKKNYVTIIKEVIVNDLEFIKNSIK